MIERVVRWDADEIVAATALHRAADNPLRRAGRLAAVHLAEFAAQAWPFMADCATRPRARDPDPRCWSRCATWCCT